MRETADRKDFDLTSFLHPAQAFRTPRDVVADPDLTLYEKRAILASWASDACAVEAAPDLRRPPSAPPVRFDDIMDALKQLDGEAADKPQYRKLINRAERWKALYRRDRDRGGGGAMFA
ncbi:MAG TPA: hypothetical protein VKX28_27435 [Xanthobacteraceae bacterium]|nr:hypothetical protein [Xanthobacteraceae bacterium]